MSAGSLFQFSTTQSAKLNFLMCVLHCGLYSLKLCPLAVNLAGLVGVGKSLISSSLSMFLWILKAWMPSDLNRPYSSDGRPNDLSLSVYDVFFISGRILVALLCIFSNLVDSFLYGTDQIALPYCKWGRIKIFI